MLDSVFKSGMLGSVGVVYTSSQIGNQPPQSNVRVQCNVVPPASRPFSRYDTLPTDELIPPSIFDRIQIAQTMPPPLTVNWEDLVPSPRYPLLEMGQRQQQMLQRPPSPPPLPIRHAPPAVPLVLPSVALEELDVLEPPRATRTKAVKTTSRRAKKTGVRTKARARKDLFESMIH